MHIVTRPREEVITVKFKCKTYEVHMGSDGAFVPNDLGEHMWMSGLVVKGHNPDPKPQWQNVGTAANPVWGDRIDPFARYVKEIPSDVDDCATPAAVAAILEDRKYRR